MRERFNNTYWSAFFFHEYGGDGASGGTDSLYRFIQTYTKRCNDLAEARETSALFIPPADRMSCADVSRKLRKLAMRSP